MNRVKLDLAVKDSQPQIGMHIIISCHLHRASVTVCTCRSQ